MRVSLLSFDESINDYTENELPVDLIEGDFALFPISANPQLYSGELGHKPIELYIKIYK
jgi:hypothetical protein